jgi:hypothetical protein
MADRRASLRASDADREQIADRLRHAAAEGRLATDELEQRLGATFAARTYSELDAVISDLPSNGVSHADRRRARRHSHAITIARPALALAVIVPVMLAVVFIATGVLAVWMLWVVCGWWFFGHRRHALAGPWGHGHRRGGPGAPRDYGHRGPYRGHGHHGRSL